MWTREENQHKSGQVCSRVHTVQCTRNLHSLWNVVGKGESVAMTCLMIRWKDGKSRNCSTIFWPATIICGKCCHNPRIWFKVLLEISWVTASSFLAGPVKSQQKKFWDQFTTFSSSPQFETAQFLQSCMWIQRYWWDLIYRHLPFVVATHRYYRHKATFFSLCTHLLGKRTMIILRKL